MRVSGFIKNTLVDFPGHVASTIFISGCNFTCGFCHNPDLVNTQLSPRLDLGDILSYIENASKKIIDGVVITGGEATLCTQGVTSLISKLRSIGVKIKLDTNGSNPDFLKNVDVDYVAMDLKTSLARYKELTAQSNIEESILESINYLQSQNRFDYEFRTTLVPDLVGENEINALSELVNPSSKWFFQNFSNSVVYDPKYLAVVPYDKEQVDRLVQLASTKVSKVTLR